MKRILFYYPSNKRTISIESVILKFRDQGHTVTLLTQSQKAELHQELEFNGIETETCFREKKNALLYYVKHIVFLVKYCKKNKVDIVYSHLQQANIISVFAQWFCSSQFYICRHHSSVSGADKNFNQTLFDKIINRFAKLIIVPSSAVYRQVNEAEGVSEKKIRKINYGYDFTKYPLPDLNEVTKIKQQYSCKLLLVKVARLVPGKRYPILFEVIREEVIERKRDIKLLVISDGPLFSEFNDYIIKNQLQNNIFLLGDRSNVIDYLYASDAVPLLSEAEASNSVIKEAGLVNKCVLVCKQVGDFEDYIQDGVSGLFMNRDNPTSDLKAHISALYDDKIDREVLGRNLHVSVIQNYSIDKVIIHYDSLNR